MTKKVIGIQVPQEVEEEIKKVALKEFTTMSAVIRRWIYKGAKMEGFDLKKGE